MLLLACIHSEGHFDQHVLRNTRSIEFQNAARKVHKTIHKATQTPMIARRCVDFVSCTPATRGTRAQNYLRISSYNDPNPLRFCGRILVAKVHAAACVRRRVRTAE